MSIVFFRRNGGGADPETPSFLTIRVWSPDEQGSPPTGSRRLSNWVWWLFDALGVFSRHGFREVTVWREGRLVHRLIVTPRWFRFPFMGPPDLQVGDLWTHPDARGQGLARLALTAAQALTEPDDVLWYLSEDRNAASIRLAENAGFQCVGIGRRTRPLGFGLLGRFRLEPSDGRP